MIDLEDREVLAFVDLALDQMMAKAVGLGPRITDRPRLDGSNSVFSLIAHCIGVSEWWLGHAVLGHPSSRDRDAEFEASGTMSDLESLVESFRSGLPNLIKQVCRTPEPQSAYLEKETGSFRTWPWTTASIVLHVIEELFQHAGHIDITADILAGERG